MVLNKGKINWKTSFNLIKGINIIIEKADLESDSQLQLALLFGDGTPPTFAS